MQDEKTDRYGNCSCKANPYVASITRTPILHSLGCWQDGISHVKSHLSRYHDPCWAPTIQTSFTEACPALEPQPSRTTQSCDLDYLQHHFSLNFTRVVLLNSLRLSDTYQRDPSFAASAARNQFRSCAQPPPISTTQSKPHGRILDFSLKTIDREPAKTDQHSSQ
jgi:hypothetical protein